MREYGLSLQAVLGTGIDKIPKAQMASNDLNPSLYGQSLEDVDNILQEACLHA